MTGFFNIEHQLVETLSRFHPATSTNSYFDTGMILYKVAITSELGEIEFGQVDSLSTSSGLVDSILVEGLADKRLQKYLLK